MQLKSEKKLMNQLKDIGAKWRVKYICKEVDYLGKSDAFGPDYNRGVMAVVLIKGHYYSGISVCNERVDPFSRRLGRTIALGRAFKAYKHRKITPKDKVDKDLIIPVKKVKKIIRKKKA